MFYLDMELPADRKTFDAAMEDLDREAEGLRVLGLYRASARAV
jgi:prephenate dehydratase